ncbi:MAG: SIS domain-containing protein [Oscillospiraceae bacterium]|nr:SIS domain-containing protein [Oscillospiraceae bacterium]
MNRTDCETSLIRQSRMAAKIVDAVLGSVDYRALDEVLPLKEIHDAQSIIITGCGDSWLAGLAVKPVFESFSGVAVNVMRCVEFSRFLSGKMLGYSPNTPLVIGISVSGAVSRTAEALARATKHNANTIAITDNPESPVGKAARHIVPLHLPEGVEYGPGANSYNGILVILLAIALRIGRAKNRISCDDYEDMKQAISDYANDVQKVMPAFEERAFELAKTWKDLRAIDFIGDYADYATAYFGSAKVIETYGGYTTYDDSEDWCHINYFLSEPETVGRVVIANKNTPSFGRLQETLQTIRQLKSPCIVVTDADKSEFPPEFEVFTVPAPRYAWLDPLMQHFPLDLLAGSIAGLLGIPQFRTDMAEFDIKGVTDGARIRGSEIVVL